MTIERRKKQFDHSSQAVELLTKAQNFALGELTSEGGELAFARQSVDGHLAIVELHGRMVTIDPHGEIDHQPDIKIRKT